MKALNPWNSLAVALGAAPLPKTPNLRDDVEEKDLGPVPTETGVSPYPNVIAPPQGPRTDLAMLRQQFPFVPIMPFPSQIVGVLLAAGVAQDLRFPPGTAVFILSGSGDYFVSMQGNAAIPTAANIESNASIFRPEFSWFFTKSSGVSVIAPNANTYVQAACYIPTDLPSFGG
jgi:hypothetical protein